MKGREIIVWTICLWSSWASAQSHEDIRKMLDLTGHETEEELSAHEVEMLQKWMERPFRINSASASSLRSCGLFSAFQAASLIDYRSRHGDIMSLNELSSIDGFTPGKVDALKHFISIEGGSPASAEGSRRKGFCDIAVKGGIRDGEGSYGLKSRGRAGEAFSFGLGLSRSYSAKHAAPDALTGHLGWEASKIPLRLTAGYFNLRFGQGLALWNGMSMGGLSKPSSFLKSGTGLSSSYSYTGSSSFRGVAGEYSFSRFRLTSAVIVPGRRSDGFSVLPAANLGWFGRNMSISATHYLELMPASGGTCIPDMKTSADIAACINGIDIFSEIAFDWANATAAALAGCTFPAWEGTRMAAHLRCYPARYEPTYSGAPRSGNKCSNETGASYCMEISPGSGILDGSISFDAAYFPESKGDTPCSVQLKATSDLKLELSGQTTVGLRISERFRTWEDSRFKTEIRADLKWTGNRFCFSSRIDILKHVGTGFLGYAEGGFKTERLSLYLKGGIYMIDNWEDRIYSYERSGPGSFSVPAFHGRGLWATLYASWKFTSWGKAYVIETVKPGKAELKLQIMFSF